MDEAERSRCINATCAPLFLGNYFLRDGHSSSTTSAAATFVKFKGQSYVLTCRHVKTAAFAQPGWTARLHAGRAVVSLSNWSSAGLVPTLRDVGGEERVDVSLCAMPDHLVEILARDKPKAPIDLDQYEEPRWDRVKFCLAAGFPDRAKSDGNSVVSAPMVEAVAELASAIDPTTASFALQSELETPSPYGFSGMSGGPIFAIWDDEPPLPIGIVFDGYPSGEEIGGSADAFLGARDILIRGYLLTPQTFAGWLRNTAG